MLPGYGAPMPMGSMPMGLPPMGVGLPPLGQFGGRPMVGGGLLQPMGMPPSVSFNYGAPFQQPVMAQPYGAQPYGAPVVRQVVQSHRPPVVQQAPAPEPEQSAPITVNLAGRTGVNDVVNGSYTSCGEYGGRYYFSMATNEGPIYLYYDQASDNWCIGEELGSQSYYAVCGPSEGQDMAQQWRIWTGEAWETDDHLKADIIGA